MAFHCGIEVGITACIVHDKDDRTDESSGRPFEITTAKGVYTRSHIYRPSDGHQRGRRGGRIRYTDNTGSTTSPRRTFHAREYVQWQLADWQLSIHALSQRGDTQALISLYESNPSLDVSERDEQDVTPLHWASINAQMSTCRWLLDHGAEVDAIGGDLKATPLQWAARNGHLYVIQLLLSRGADPNIADDQGFNTLHLITHSSGVMPLLYIVSHIHG